jgi:hypothetical protein
MRITVDMTKAREIAKDIVRAERAPLLQQLDVEMIRAIEAGDAAKQAEIAARKQALRDATKAPELLAAETPDALKAAIPQVLAV